MKKYWPLVLVFWSIPTWVLAIAVRAVPWLLGLYVIWLEACWTVRRRSKLYPDRIVTRFQSPLMWLWDNEEDGCDGLRGGNPAQTWWMAQTLGWAVEKRIWRWSAWRNPVNNMRYVPIISPRIPPRGSSLIGCVGTGAEPPDGQAGWAFCWFGPYTGLYVKRASFWLWIGWKIRPSDRLGVDARDTRNPRYDFALQFKRISA